MSPAAPRTDHTHVLLLRGINVGRSNRVGRDTLIRWARAAGGEAHYPGAAALGHGQGYVYSHDEPHAVARQQYAPDPLVGRDYYRPKPIGHEKRLTEQVAALRRIIRGD